MRNCYALFICVSHRKASFFVGGDTVCVSCILNEGFRSFDIDNVDQQKIKEIFAAAASAPFECLSVKFATLNGNMTA
jgi:hypothetical protein